MPERKHQQLIRARFNEIGKGLITDPSTTLDACPGGGKSRCVIIAIEELQKAGKHAGLIWLVPRASLAAQSRKAFNTAMAPLRLDTVRLQRHVGYGNIFGFVSTYQRFTSKRAADYAAMVAKNIGNRRGTVLIALDELHHCTASDAQAWTAGVRTLEKALRKVGCELHFLNMSGTMFRKDMQPILNVVYKDGNPVTHVQYSFRDGRDEKAVIPPEFVYVDGKVTIRSKALREATYDCMADVPQSHRSKVIRAFLGGSTNKAVQLGKDSRELTSLWLMRYGMDHFIAKRKEFNYPLQTIVVAPTASAAIGYTGWLRSNYPDIKTAVSLSHDEACEYGHDGFQRILFPEPIIVNHDGTLDDVSDTINVMGSESENVSTWIDDPHSILKGVPPANYNLALTDAELKGSRREWKDLAMGEKVIRAFQSPVVDGENVIDVLVTVGKAYEGLDAPRCSHLICLTRQRSAPWLAQCFARAWRFDYDLKAAGVESQRCWIFAPRDHDMKEAVERIVSGQPLSGTYEPLTEADMECDDDDDDGFSDVEFSETTSPTAKLDPTEIDWSLKGPDEIDEISEDEETSAEDCDGITAVNDQDEPIKPKGIVRAFNVIERVIHQFVDDSNDSFDVIKTKVVDHTHLLAEVSQ